ncbi:MAG: di-heme oxidoredictase family protein [Candidatus Thioglobus sp.]|uniref:di-heme oxidoreductase family protein n=1 Tax=Candidatus Thioglobus sp. TaxID=2026721 RepID=UPI0026397F7C|nr:di-heme oxidoredictase family protein [Candidatus Thioglobus sp.]MDC9726773.1 di-heme oxidoredictase family protein [Candidatus Thioglobus sp.]
MKIRNTIFLVVCLFAGHALSINNSINQSFLLPAKGLDNDQFDQFILGKSFFRIPWVESPTATTARDGLGPLFNSNTCVNCHNKNGRGKVYDHDQVVDRSHVVRLSIPANDSEKHQQLLKMQGFIAEPTYGAQVSVNGVSGVPYEAKMEVEYTDVNINYPNGAQATLQQPNLKLTNLGYGALHPQAIVAARIAPALVGLGLIEQITDEQILAHEDVDDINGDGISGKANRVWSLETNKTEIGRYTWKASAPTLRHQSANAAVSDMGLTNPLHPNETCTSKQTECLKAPKGDYFEFDLTEPRLNAITFYLSNLALPSSKKSNKKGVQLFESTGCSDCHQPSYQLSSVKSIHPYSDFLLHDMGKGLADGRQEFLASGSEWRTPPLWKTYRVSQILGKQKNFLHDGRARTVEEAILWHGGEASKAKALFMNLRQDQRAELLKFVDNL